MKLKITLVLIFLTLNIICGAQTWQWAQKISGLSNGGNPEILSNITDGDNTYVFGNFVNSINLPGGSISANGTNDMIIAKFDGTGNQLWAKSYGGNLNTTTDDEDVDVKYDSIGQCLYLLGRYMGQCTLDSSIHLTGGGFNTSDLFIAKMDTNGNFIWAQGFGSSGADFGHIYIQPDGRILVIGTMGGPGMIQSYSLTYGGFLAQFDTSGNCVNAKNFVSGFNLYEVEVAFNDNKMFMSGGFPAPSVTVDGITVQGSASVNSWIGVADMSGNLQSLKGYGKTGTNFLGVHFDLFGNFYLTGVYTDSLIIGNLSVHNNTPDWIIAKGDTSGNFIWVKTGSTTGTYGVISSVYFDNTGISTFSGSWSGTSNFAGNTITAQSPQDGFITQIDSNGNFVGFKHYGEAGGGTVVLDHNRSIYICASFRNTIYLGTTLVANQNPDYFIAKIGQLTGSEEIDRNETDLMYPNPTNDLITAHWMSNKSTITLYDLMGKLIFNVFINSDHFTLSFKKLNIEQGCYILKIKSSNKEKTQRIIYFNQ